MIEIKINGYWVKYNSEEHKEVLPYSDIRETHPLIESKK